MDLRSTSPDRIVHKYHLLKQYYAYQKTENVTLILYNDRQRWITVHACWQISDDLKPIRFVTIASVVSPELNSLLGLWTEDTWCRQMSNLISATTFPPESPQTPLQEVNAPCSHSST